MAATGNFFLGTPQRIEQVPRYNSQQQDIMSQVLGRAWGGLQNPTKGFEPIAQNAVNRFNQQIIPSLSERFSSMGQNSISSPAYTSQLGQASAGLASDLASQEAQYGLENQSQLMQLLGIGLTPQHENIGVSGESGLLQQILPFLGRLGSHAGAGYLTGGASGAGSALSEILRLLSNPQQRVGQ